MASATCCCVPKCGTTGKDGKILHSFPNPDMDRNRYFAWIQAVEMDTSLDPKFVYKYRRVCHDHFESFFLTWSRRLSRDAVPTLLLPGDITTRVPLLKIKKEIANVTFDSALASTSKGESSDQESVGSSPQNASATVPKKPGKFSNKKELIKKIKRLQLEKKSYTRRLANALTLSKNKTFQKAITKFTTFAAMFIVMQFREIHKNKLGRRFSESEKIMALSLYKQGPRAYRWLQRYFILPSTMTLKRLLARANLKPGINENVNEQ